MVFFLFGDVQLNRSEVNREGIYIEQLANPAAPGKLAFSILC